MPVLSVVMPNAEKPESSRASGRCGVPKAPVPCRRGGLSSPPRSAALPDGMSSSGNGSVSLLMGRLERASIHEALDFPGSASLSFPRLLSEAFSRGSFSKSSPLVLPMRPLNLLSPRRLPKPAFFSGCGLPKLPKAPIGEKEFPADADHGEAEPPGLNGAVVVRLRLPKGPAFSAAPLSLSRSSPLPLGVGSL